MNQYHIACSKGDIGPYAILPGDPARVAKIASYLENAQKIAVNREFTTYTGFLDGEKVTVTSTGIGGPSAAIAMQELTQLGAHTFIRIGTCGGVNTAVKSGESVIASGAVRQDGASREYAPIEYPAVADYTVLHALVNSAEELGLAYHVGVVQSKDSFYGQHDPASMPVAYELINKWEAWKKLGVLASEMEAATLFTVAAALGARCGAVFHVLWNQERKKAGLHEEDSLEADRAIQISINAIRALIKKDKSI